MHEGKVLIVEDTEDLRELVHLYLEKNHFQVLAAANGEQALRLFHEHAPDVIVMDVMLPDANGIELCQEIRKTSDVPIIFVSRMRDADDIISGLELGGDDYMTKPFDPNVLVARIKANIRRVARGHKEQRNKDDRFWRSGGLEIDLLSYSVKVDGKPISLFAKELQLLLFFVQNPNRVFGFQQLLDQVWGRDHIRDERTVMVQISNLRKKIEKDPANPQFIRTVRGFGYKFQFEEK
jgi:DNA-binding response OmpR family regulator